MEPQKKPSHLRAAALIAASTYVTTALGFLVSIVIARALGPHDYGQYAYLVWLSGFLLTIGNHGLGISGIRFISEYIGRGEQAEARNIHRWLRNQQTLSAAVVVVVFAISTYFFRPAGWQGSIFLLLGIIVVSVTGKAFYMFNISVAKGYKQFSVESWCNIIMSSAYTLGAVCLALTHASLIGFAIFFGAISAAHMGTVTYFFKKNGISAGTGQCQSETLTRVKSYLRWTTVLVVVSTLSNKTMETLLLSSLTGPAEVGFFSIATALTRGGVDLLSSTLTTMLMPLMSHAYGEGGIRKVNPILSRSLRYFAFLGLLLAGVGALWSELGVMVMYGEKYTPVVNVLRVMMLVGGLTLTEGAFGALLSTTDHQNLRAQISILSVVVSVLASATLVPIYGLTGAVISHAVTRVLILALLAWRILRSMDVDLPWQALTRLIQAAVIPFGLIGPILWMSNAPVVEFACGALFALTFVPITFLLGAWSQDDLTHLQPVIRRLPPRVQLWLHNHASARDE